MLSVYFETYGCSSNFSETEIMKGILKQAGLELTNNEEIADILIINTCVVKGPTVSKIKERIRCLSKLRKPLIIAGCMPAVMNKDIIKLNKDVSLISTHNIVRISSVVKKVLEGKTVRLTEYKQEIKLNKPRIRANKRIAIISISSGCLGNCSFCLTHLAKGRLHSFPEEEIINEIESSLESGCREIWLTSQDLASYGLESSDKKAFVGLLKKILSLEDNFKLRLGMMNPNHVLPIIDELIEIYNDERVYKFLHIPLQSGSNKILKAMNRKYNAGEFLDIAKRFRTKFPQGVIATDIIAGYPGETEEEFTETLKLMKETKPDVVNFTRFWPMKGTRAANLPQLDRKIASMRAAEVQKLHLQISLERNKEYENKILEVFVNEQEGTNCLAREENYRLVVIKSEKKLLGKKLKVIVKKAFSHYLLAEII